MTENTKHTIPSRKGRIPVTYYLPPKLKDEVYVRAIRHHRTVGEEAQALIELGLAHSPDGRAKEDK